MSYETEIKKVELMPFAELFEITSGERVWRYTSYGKDITFGGNVYRAAVIKRTVPSENEDFKPTRMDITMPVVDPVNAYIANTPIEPTKFKVTRVFIHDDTAKKIIFSGEALGVTFVEAGEHGIAVANAEGGSIYFRNKIPREVFQAYCNNTLYKASETGRPNCSLLKENFETSTIITISGNDLVSSDFDAEDDGYFIGGHVETSYGDFRYITNHVGDTITLNTSFDSRLGTGATISAYPGCDKSPPTCTNKFNNFSNYRGFPYIPSVNPTVWGVK